MPSPEQIDLTPSGPSAAVALHGAQLISLVGPDTALYEIPR